MKAGPAQWKAITTAITGPTTLSRILPPGFCGGVAANDQAFSDEATEPDPLQGFLNNKNNFKTRGWSTASSPWLLDEPANFQDYWAIRYFAVAFHEGVNQAMSGSASTSASLPKMVFRADISRPQWQRDTLDGLLDYNVVSNAVRTYPRLVLDRKSTLEPDRRRIWLNQSD